MKMIFNLIKFLPKRYTHTWIKPKGHNTGIKIYNTILGEQVPFITAKKGVLTWYTCGPTVYDSAHIGHAVCYIKLDIIQRTLRKIFNINIVTVMNITDIDDKIITKAKSTNTPYRDLTRHYENEFLSDLSSLKIEPPSQIVRVTEHMDLIIDYIQTLIRSKNAYVGKDGSTYFDVAAYKNYGKLRKIVLDVDYDKKQNEKSAKKSPLDFALWKAAKEGEPHWNAPFGLGRPGWHIECSALASTTLGSSIDVHAGGVDLCFPHHENEEAQSCAYFSTPQWVNYWIHPGHLIIKNNKMSKSLGNCIYIAEFLKNYSADELRMACLMSPYRNNMEFSDALLKLAKANLNTFTNFFNLSKDILQGRLSGNINDPVLYSNLETAVAHISHSLANDFDTTNVIKKLHHLVTAINKMVDNNSDNRTLTNNTQLIATTNFIKDTLCMFGFELEENLDKKGTTENNSDIVDLLVKFRSDVRIIAKADKNINVLQLCDNVRDSADKCGIKIKDFKSESSWSKC